MAYFFLAGALEDGNRSLGAEGINRPEFLLEDSRYKNSRALKAWF